MKHADKLLQWFLSSCFNSVITPPALPVFILVPLHPTESNFSADMWFSLRYSKMLDFKHSAVLYCIVLYLYIYIALLAVHTNQKRFQCERPREKRAVLRAEQPSGVT